MRKSVISPLIAAKLATANLITAKSISAVAVAAFVAGFAVLLTSVVAPEAKADLQVKSALPLAKGDRLLARTTGAACSSLGWPHYEPACQFDMRRPGNQARTVRVIALR